LQKELTRLKDNRDLLKLKNSALNFDKSGAGAESGVDIKSTS